MTGTDFDRTARAWLQDGPVVMSDRALQAALDEVHQTRQRRAIWPAWRNAPMNTTVFRFAALAAGVLVIAVLGFSILPGIGPGGPTTPAPTTPAPTPTLATPPSADPSPRAVGITFDPALPFRLLLTLPPGWSGEDGSFVVQKYGGALPNGMAIATWIVGNVYTDGCNWSGTLRDPAVGPTVDDLANAISGLEDRVTTAPADVTVDGYAGKELEMTIPDVDFTTCDQGEFRSWTALDGSSRFHQGPLEHSRILILDVDGTRVLVFGRSFPGTSPADLAELNTILDTMQIDGRAASTGAPSASP